MSDSGSLEIIPPINDPYDGLAEIDVFRDRVWGFFGQLSVEPVYTSDGSKDNRFYYVRNPLAYTTFRIGIGNEGLETLVTINIHYQRSKHVVIDKEGLDRKDKNYFIRINELGKIETDLPEALGGFSYGFSKVEALRVNPQIFILLCYIGIRIFSGVVNDEKYELGSGAGRTITSSDVGYKSFRPIEEFSREIPGLPKEIGWRIYDGMQGNTKSILKNIGISQKDPDKDIYDLMGKILQNAINRSSGN